MTLSELITALQGTLVVTVVDSDNSTLLKFYTGGAVASLSSTLLEREVSKLTIANNAITVLLAATT